MPMVSGLSSQRDGLVTHLVIKSLLFAAVFFCLFPDDNSMWWDYVRAINVTSCSAGIIRVLIARTYPSGRMYEKKNVI